MRSLVALVAFLSLSLALAGCSGNSGDSDEPTPTSTPTQPTGPTDDVLANHTALLAATPTSGDVILNVTFAVSADDGEPQNATWVLTFGDASGQANGTSLPGNATHAYATGGNYTAQLTITFADLQVERANVTIQVTVPEAPDDGEGGEPLAPPVTHYELGPSSGCAGDVLAAAGQACISQGLGPDAEPIDGFWIPLDLRFWGQDVTSTITGGIDSDCNFLDEAHTVIGEANNGQGTCTGTVTKGAAWLFIYPYATPAAGMTVDFDL